MVRAAALALLLLAGCEPEPDYASTEDMVDDFAGAAADAAVLPLRARLDELETKVADLESENQRLRLQSIESSEQSARNARQIADLQQRLTLQAIAR